MSPGGDNWGPRHDYGPATWTDLMRIREYRERISNSKRLLRILLEDSANPIEIVQERMALKGAEWELRQLQSKFELKPFYF